MYLDNKLADIFVNKTEIFKNIHPNVFSSISIILNIFIFNILNGWNLSTITIAVLISIRCMTDILDGAIARKYNKVSIIGGILDTVGDISLLCIVVWFVMKWFGMHYSIYIIFLFLVGSLIVTYDLYHDHSAAKIYNNNILNNCIAFAINNTVVFYTILYGIIIYKFKNSTNEYLDTPAKN